LLQSPFFVLVKFIIDFTQYKGVQYDCLVLTDLSFDSVLKD
jgi:hypothetical protein